MKAVHGTEKWGTNGTFAWRDLPPEHPTGCECGLCWARQKIEEADRTHSCLICRKPRDLEITSGGCSCFLPRYDTSEFNAALRRGIEAANDKMKRDERLAWVGLLCFSALILTAMLYVDVIAAWLGL